MYLMVIHIPIYVEGSRYYTDISWQRDLVLARDWLAKPHGGLKLLAPSLPRDAVESEVMQLAPIGCDDGIQVVPSFDPRCRDREFWLRQRRQWMSDVRRELRDASVIHVSACNAYRPLGFMANKAGAEAGVTTVLVGPDMDLHVTMPPGAGGRLYCKVFDELMRRAMRRSDLILLKEGLVYERYARLGGNVRAFCHTMHMRRDVLDQALLEKRLAGMRRDRPLRAVFAGRFVPRKGLHHSIAAIAGARRRGVDVEYHLYGGGPEEDSLRRLAAELDVEDLVHFHGFVEYSSQFIAELAGYDLLLFMPTEEDTPRMVYDAMAAGLPLVGSRIPFLVHRVDSDRMGVLVDIGDHAAAADLLCRLREDPARLGLLSKAALAAGKRHATEEWYRLRSDWTRLAVEQNRSKHTTIL